MDELGDELYRAGQAANPFSTARSTVPCPEAQIGDHSYDRPPPAARVSTSPPLVATR